MIDVSGLKLSLDAGLTDGQALALREIARQLGVKPGAIERAQLLKRSVDARKKANVHFTASYRLELSSECEERLLTRAERNDAKLKGLQIRPATPYVPLEIPQLGASDLPPVVVGAGPAGLFAAWYLAKSGLKPLLVEQGAPVEERTHDVETSFKRESSTPGRTYSLAKVVRARFPTASSRPTSRIVIRHTCCTGSLMRVLPRASCGKRILTWEAIILRASCPPFVKTSSALAAKCVFTRSLLR